MTEQARKARNASMLAEVYSALRPKIAAILHDLEAHGLRPRIQCAWRDPKDQIKAYDAGNSKVLWGFHCATSATGQPAALAVDILDDSDPGSERGPRFALMLASSARAHGLQTGILWGLSKSRQEDVNRAIAHRDWAYRGEVGWDSLHVEVKGISTTQARAGARPQA